MCPVLVYSSSPKAFFSAGSWMAFLLKRFPALQKIFFFRWVFPKIGGTPKSSILIGFSIINHPFWGTPIFGNTQMFNRQFFFSSPRFVDGERAIFLFRRKSWNFQCMNCTIFFPLKLKRFWGPKKPQVPVFNHHYTSCIFFVGWCHFSWPPVASHHHFRKKLWGWKRAVQPW